MRRELAAVVYVSQLAYVGIIQLYIIHGNYLNGMEQLQYHSTLLLISKICRKVMSLSLNKLKLACSVLGDKCTWVQGTTQDDSGNPWDELGPRQGRNQTQKRMYLTMLY